MSWRGELGKYQPIAPGVAGGGGSVPSTFSLGGRFQVIRPGVAGGGGRDSGGDPAPGAGGCGGPGPGALIGLRP